MADFEWKPYVPVAQRREKTERAMARRRKRGLAVEPVTVKGRTIARSFWGRAWCDHLLKFSDYANRLPRGATYVRNGSVCHLAVAPGEISALVMGSKLYEATVRVKPLGEKRWREVRRRCAGSVGSLLELLEGRLSEHVMATVTDTHEGLFPLPREIELECSCPDWASLCKHLAAALYGVGARLDHQPELLFTLRGVDQRELIADEADAVEAVTAAVGGSGPQHRRLDAGVLGDIFGIDLETAERETGRSTTSAGRRRASSRSKALASGAPNAAPRSAGKTWTPGRVRRLRARLGLSRSAFARELGISSTSVRLWEESGGRLRLQERTRAALDACDARTALAAPLQPAGPGA